MRYISLLIVSILTLAACSEVDVEMNASDSSSSIATVGFRDTEFPISEEEDSGSVYIDFSKAVTVATEVRVAISNENNMREETDYFINDKNLTIAAGEKSLKVDFSLVDDNIVNSNRSFTLQLVFVNGAVIDSVKSRVEVRVIDNESTGILGFTTSVIECLENNEVETPYEFLIPVEFSGEFNKPIRFSVSIKSLELDDDVEGEVGNAAIEGVHYRLDQTTFVIESADAEVFVPIVILDDNIVNADRKLILDITDVVGAEINTPNKRCVISIINDEMGIYFGKSLMVEEERAGVVNVPVRLTAITDVDVPFTLKFDGTAAAGSDYTIETTSWVIPAGQDSVDVKVALTNVADLYAQNRVLQLDFDVLPEGMQIFDLLGKTCEMTILDCSNQLSFEYATFSMFNDSINKIITLKLDNVVEHDVTFKVGIKDVEGMSEDDVVIKDADSVITILAGSKSASIRLTLPVVRPEKKTANVELEILEAYGATVVSTSKLHKAYKYTNEPGEDGKKYFEIAGFSSEEKETCAANVVDGDMKTRWHSRWNANGNGGPVDEGLPQGIIIGLLDGMIAGGVEVFIGTDSYTRGVTVFTGESTEYLRNDATCAAVWGLPLGALAWAATGTSETVEFSKATKTYIKLEVDVSTHALHANLTEVSVYGFYDSNK